MTTTLFSVMRPIQRQRRRYLAPLVVGVLANALYAAPAVAAPVDAAAALTDAELVWDTRVLYVADARRIVAQSPKLAPWVDRVIDRAGRYSVNPRLLALLADESDLLGNLDGLDSTAAGERLDQFVGAVSHMFETGRSQQDGGIARTRARVLALAGQSFGARAVAATFLAGDGEARKLSERWRTRYGAPQVAVEAESEKAAPALFLRLPWLAGQSGWRFQRCTHHIRQLQPHALCVAAIVHRFLAWLAAVDHKHNQCAGACGAWRYGHCVLFVQCSRDQCQRLGHQLLPPVQCGGEQRGHGSHQPAAGRLCRQ